jgi:hypothetical protein
MSHRFRSCCVKDHDILPHSFDTITKDGFHYSTTDRVFSWLQLILICIHFLPTVQLSALRYRSPTRVPLLFLELTAVASATTKAAADGPVIIWLMYIRVQSSVLWMSYILSGTSTLRPTEVEFDARCMSCRPWVPSKMHVYNQKAVGCGVRVSKDKLFFGMRSLWASFDVDEKSNQYTHRWLLMKRSDCL